MTAYHGQDQQDRHIQSECNAGMLKVGKPSEPTFNSQTVPGVGLHPSTAKARESEKANDWKRMEALTVLCSALCSLLSARHSHDVHAWLGEEIAEMTSNSFDNPCPLLDSMEAGSDEYDIAAPQLPIVPINGTIGNKAPARPLHRPQYDRTATKISTSFGLMHRLAVGWHGCLLGGNTSVRSVSTGINDDYMAVSHNLPLFHHIILALILERYPWT